jgi:predicted dehydrogenase
MLKVAIIGCGKIADSHAAQITRIPGVEIVGACDREELMARQLAERFPIKGYFSDVGELLKKAQPQVVHITTPPQGHFDLARQCLDHGCHVYVEKPFTVYAEETRELLAYAERCNLKITAGHDDQFSHVARLLRKTVQDGYLGGAPIHMESYYCYDLTEPGYAKALLADKNHWVRKLPGQLLQNVISHGIARIAEYLQPEDFEVVVHGFTSPFLRSLGEEEIVDELRVIISQNGHTAYFTFSSQMRPSLHHFRVFGPKNGIILDEDHQTLILQPGKRHKSYIEKVVPAANASVQYAKNILRNTRLFLKNDFHMKSGMKFLIESFYNSIRFGHPLPIRPDEIATTAEIMERIFDQLNARPTSPKSSPSKPSSFSPLELCPQV